MGEYFRPGQNHSVRHHVLTQQNKRDPQKSWSHFRSLQYTGSSQTKPWIAHFSSYL